MGYTRYYDVKEEFPTEEWMEYITDVELILENLPSDIDGDPLTVQFEDDDPTRPQLSVAEGVRFNGAGEFGHETFLLRNKVEWSFCKTARKPYDFAVCACLERAKDRFGNRIEVKSDGPNDDDKVHAFLADLFAGKTRKSEPTGITRPRFVQEVFDNNLSNPWF